MGALCRFLTLFLKFKLLITGFMHDLQKSPVCHLLSCLILCLHSASRLETERGKLALRMALPGMFLNLLYMYCNPLLFMVSTIWNNVPNFLFQVCGSSEDQVLPPNFIKLAKDVYTPDLIAASDCMLGK